MCVELTPFASSLEDGVTNRDTIVLRSGFLFLFRKKEKGVASSDALSAAKLPVAGLRRQAAGGLLIVTYRTSTSVVVFCRLRRR